MRICLRCSIVTVIAVATLLSVNTWLSFSALAKPLGVQVNCTGSIQACIDAANDGDTIVIAAGTYTESLTLSKPVSLTGVNSDTTILHAVAGQRVLTVTGATISNSVVISGLTFTGGSASSGGGLYADPEVTLINARFISNTATNIGGGVYVSDLVVVTNSIFDGNYANLGGGLYTFNNAQLTNSRFQQNNADFTGGGLVVKQSAILTDSNFISNTAQQYGGAILGGPASINGGHFINNHSLAANSLGGGLGVDHDTTISGTQFISNTSGGSGGGLYASEAVTLTNVEFISNTAADGGGGAAMGTNVTVNGGRFVNNVSFQQGGGISAQNVTVHSAEFIGNACTDEGRASGGAILSSQASITDSRFERNWASAWGGGISASSIHVSHSQFISNTASAGGAVYADTSASFETVSFEGNRALTGVPGHGLGGAFFVELPGTIISVSDSKFIANYADYGGAIQTWADSSIAITNSLFDRNSAGVSGDTLYMDSAGSVVTFLHNTIVGTNPNSIEAVAINQGILYLTNTIITNHAIGISSTGGLVTEDYNLFYNNLTNTVGISNGVHSLIGDPRLVDPAHNDYHLAFGSAAIDHGVDAGVYTDLDDNFRPLGSGFDIGAYEYQGTTYHTFLPVLRR